MTPISIPLFKAIDEAIVSEWGYDLFVKVLAGRMPDDERLDHAPGRRQPLATITRDAAVHGGLTEGSAAALGSQHFVVERES